ncbi:MULTISPECIES: FprA family A-type flavoprotein [Olsenella]|uniref:FprA family A-type flavoprotein n=1 Tax=Olsenella TaxID=133925 RepID=UPI00071CE8A4|nr:MULTISPECIES: FprA family A-type flavoprotein [Olsenella]OFK24856.1 MBL fold metallo-hydrolase [Olsenella sp. HMSC062G07]
MYCVRNVTDDIYWIGANDHRTHLFENIHPIPQGVSYNCYVLLDEKTAMFDTIEWGQGRQMMSNLEHVLDGRDLDYLVVNHLEPDHAASTGLILSRYPNVKVISSEKCFMLMHQFGFDVDAHEQIQVKEGDTFSFGKHTVTFVEAPMVHWPEVMVTFDLTEGVLFSADAFGGFIANDGKLWSTDVDWKANNLDEIRRYHCNIVGKYGPHVQLLLGKAATILDKIKIVCPLHGLIYHADDDLMTYIDKLNHWSSYTPEEKGVLIAYASMYGNTESAAQALASAICEKGFTNVKVCDISETHVSYLIADVFKYSHLVLASPTYNLNIYPVMENFLNEMRMLNMQNRHVAIIENGSWAITSGDLMQEFLEDEMKDMTVMNERISIASSLSGDKKRDVDDMAQAIIDSMEEVTCDPAKRFEKKQH